MAKINTLNYQTVASWNGSQDLFIVEQPDGTKVATPAMIKQFIEAGDFEATGEVKDGHGNILKDMAKSADVDAEIDALTSETVPFIFSGTIPASSITEALGKAWDSLTVYDKPVIVHFGWQGVNMALMYKYTGSQYGMAMAMRYLYTNIYTMSVNNGIKTYATK